jgi:hypothetical protein
MAVHLEEYQDILDEFPEDAIELLRSSWVEASRVLSPRGLDNYIKGASAISNMSRSSTVVLSYLQSAPNLAKEVGEDSIVLLVDSVLGFASKTSASVLDLIINTSPVAAARLGDAQLFESYLNLVGHLMAQAPRGVRYMLENLELLFSNLTLGGLRRWAMWGAHAYRVDFEGQVAYFSLQSPVSHNVLQRERKGTLFIDVQRRLNIYLRALWGRDFFLRPTSGDFENREGLRPFIDNFMIHIADAHDDFRGFDGGDTVIASGLEVYRASVAHAAAHLVYSTTRLTPETLSLLGMTIVGIIEDARVEKLAIAEFPNLKGLWLKFHADLRNKTDVLESLLVRVSRALLDDDYIDDHPMVARARQLFNEHPDIQSPNFAREVGVPLAREIDRFGMTEFSPKMMMHEAAYRDDNRFIWWSDAYDEELALEASWNTGQQIRKKVSVMELVNEVEVELAGDDAQEVWVLPTELFPYEDMGISYNDSEGKEQPLEPVHYHEWDYQIQVERPLWATVLERRAKMGDITIVDELRAAHRPVISRLKFLIESMVPQGMQRIRRQETGDDIDINAAVAAMIDIRMHQQPDERIMIRYQRKIRDVSLVVLLDLSESTNDKVKGKDYSVLDLTRSASVLLAEALSKIGDPFAIHGFCSKGRHDVHYYRFKDFDEEFGDEAKARLAGMKGDFSTRMGTALRHAGSHLKRQSATKKLILLITEGEPADNDVSDPQYLRMDAKHAVEELASDGIMTYCLTLDPHADHYVSRIFGNSHYTVIDHVEKLPEKLPMLYMSLTK